MNTYFRFTFRLSGSALISVARTDFGGLLRKLNLKYRTQKTWCPYQYQPSGLECHWELVFLICPPERQPDTRLATIQGLISRDLPEFEASHPELGKVTIYRNLSDYPHLLHQMPDWNK